MSDKTMYTITNIPEYARHQTSRNLAVLYRESQHHEQINKSINYDEATKRLEKQRDPEGIEKGEGEGSKGGKVIGHTSSGKAIYFHKNADHPDHAEFSKKDHEEASDIHSSHAMKNKDNDVVKKASRKRAKGHDELAQTKGGEEDKKMSFSHGQEAHEYEAEQAAQYTGGNKDAAFHSKVADHYEKNGETHLTKPEHQRASDYADMMVNDADSGSEKEKHWKALKDHHDEKSGRKAEIKKAEEVLIGACIDNMIEKGEISDTLGRGYGPGSEPVKFNKTGKEIKEKIPTILTALATEVGKAEGMMTEIQKEIGLEPNEPRNSYSFKNINVMSYNWDLCNPAYDKMNQCYPAPSDQNLLCSKYNSLGYMVLSMQEDVATLNVMQGNLEDGKKYTLSVSQLIALGF